ncbi:MAG: FAD binding domain-containing protein [Candidatus Hodarchaeales archaeon]|jgi:carbon-monoxide dehydrogenase medium subunit
MKQLQEYIYPSSIEEALSFLDESTEIIAGGTHITVSRNQAFKRLVDISKIGLNYIKKEDHQVRIGSATTVTEMIESPIVREIGNGVLTKACQLIGDTPLRNVITLGGNIARYYPWAGLPVVLLVVDAEIVIVDQEETEQIISATKYFKKAKVNPGEIIKEVIFPLKSDWFCRYEKFALTTVDYSWLTMAFAAKNEGGSITDPHMAVSRITKVTRVSEVEKLLEGKELTKLIIDEVIQTLRTSVNVVSDYRSSKEYREHLLGILFKRTLNEMKEEGK